ncbi:hypothetical protein [Actinomadura verrucosospora]|uniref:hypothetical protein n=1 Tax=Actinomadura verrucosospora TaxID=46165 RepID=UPI0015636598|nr:hypothetical protein [Actinomadura verrucosospora]
MYLPQEEQRSGRYDLPQLLDEEGPRSDGTVKDYVVPEERDEVVRLPDGLFVNGWIHVLEDTELAFLLMIAHEMQMRGEPSVSISSHVRLYHFGIGPHAHGKHLLLQRFGLLHTDVDSSRDEKGRVPHPNDPLLLGLHRFRLLTDGFSRPAVDVVIDALNDHPGS